MSEPAYNEYANGDLTQGAVAGSELDAALASSPDWELSSGKRRRGKPKAEEPAAPQEPEADPEAETPPETPEPEDAPEADPAE